MQRVRAAEAARKPSLWDRLRFFRMRSTMSHTVATDRRGFRPRGLSPALAAKHDRITVAVERKRRIAEVRRPCWRFGSTVSKREQEMRRQRSVGDGALQELWATALCAAADFEMIVSELRK